MTGATDFVRCELDNWRAPRHGRFMSIFTEKAKKVAIYVWQSRNRGAMLVLVSVFSPILVPLVLLWSFVGLLFAVPLLCAAAAYYLDFHNTVLQVRGTVQLLLVSARWNGQYDQRNDEATWSLNGTGDVFISQCGVADASSNELSRSAGGRMGLGEEMGVVEANRPYANSSPNVTSVDPAEFSLKGKSLPSGEEAQLQMYRYSDASEGIEGEPEAHSMSSSSEKTKSSPRVSVSGLPEEDYTIENFNDISPDFKKRSVSTSFFSNYTWPADSSEQDFEQNLATRGTAFEGLCLHTASRAVQYVEDSNPEPGILSDSTFCSTPDQLTEDWETRRKTWEVESTQGRLAPLSTSKEDNSVHAPRSMFNPLFEFESTSSPPLKNIRTGDKSPVSNSPSFHTRLRKPHSTSPKLRRNLTWSSSSTLSPSQLRFHKCNCNLQVEENEQGKASNCESCARARDGERTSGAGTKTQVSHPFPWR
ncbi:hypothetical protein M758_3G202200 [Ceratodon purpureus]|nr:hypothetical protein M758_3G202200 [Ceratodon purpureus]